MKWCLNCLLACDLFARVVCCLLLASFFCFCFLFVMRNWGFLVDLAEFSMVTRRNFISVIFSVHFVSNQDGNQRTKE